MNRNNLKLASMIALGVVVLLLLIYTGGLLAEFLAHQQEWQAAGGFTNSNIEVAKLSFNPAVVLSYSFTSAGLRLTLLEVFLIGGFICYQVSGKWRKKKAYDDNNFVVSESGTYGSARWMEHSEAARVLAIESPKNAKGVILGEFYDRNANPLRRLHECELVSMPQDTRLNGHMLVFGPSGSGKSRWLRNLLFQAMLNEQSVITTDPKGELCIDTAMMFYQRGYTVRVLNLKDPEHSHQWNPFSAIDPSDTLTCKRLAKMIIANTNDGNSGDAFFDNGEEALLSMLIIYMLNREGATPEEKSFSYLLSLLDEKNIKRLESDVDQNPFHPAYSAYQKYKRQSPTQRESFATGLYVRLHLVEDQRLKHMLTNSNDDLAIDLDLPAYEKCAYFIVLPAGDTSFQFLSSMFFTLLIEHLEHYAETHRDENNEARCPQVVNLFLDEFCTIGKLGTTIETIEQMLSTVRSYNLRMLLVVQSLGQLENIYGKGLSNSIVGNCNIQVLLACGDDLTADYFSKRCGQTTTVVESTRVTKQTLAIAQVIPSYGESSGEGKRELMTPYEIKTLRKSREYRMLVAVQDQPVLDLDRFDYTRHWMSKQIQQIEIEDFIAMDEQNSAAKRDAALRAELAQRAIEAQREAEALESQRRQEARERKIDEAYDKQALAAQLELERSQMEAEKAKAELAILQAQAAKAQAEQAAAELALAKLKTEQGSAEAISSTEFGDDAGDASEKADEPETAPERTTEIFEVVDYFTTRSEDEQPAASAANAAPETPIQMAAPSEILTTEFEQSAPADKPALPQSKKKLQNSDKRKNIFTSIIQEDE